MILSFFATVVLLFYMISEIKSTFCCKDIQLSLIFSWESPPMGLPPWELKGGLTCLGPREERVEKDGESPIATVGQKKHPAKLLGTALYLQTYAAHICALLALSAYSGRPSSTPALLLPRLFFSFASLKPTRACVCVRVCVRESCVADCSSRGGGKELAAGRNFAVQHTPCFPKIKASTIFVHRIK